MGNILLVKVTATTFDEKEVKKRYPKLSALVWNEKDKYIPASQYYGILDLITSLEQSLQYASWEEEVKSLLSSPIQELSKMKKELDKLILDWKPKEANPLTYSIEEKLDELEKIIKSEKIKP